MDILALKLALKAAIAHIDGKTYAPPPVLYAYRDSGETYKFTATLEGYTLSQGAVLSMIFDNDVGTASGCVNVNGTKAYLRLIHPNGQNRVVTPDANHFRTGRPYLFLYLDKGGANKYLVCVTPKVTPADFTEAVGVLQGGTGATTAAQARENLGIVIQHGTVTLTNSQQFPFNDSDMTVALDSAVTDTNYVVSAQVVSSVGNCGDIEIFDKLTNGFKIKYNGSASSAVVNYIVLGGFTEL